MPTTQREIRYRTTEELTRRRRFAEARATQAVATDAVTAIRSWALLDTLLSSGLRASEVAALRVGDCLLGYGQSSLIVQNGKGGKTREVFIAEELKRHLKAFIGWRRDCEEDVSDSAPLFTGQRGPLTRNGVWRLVKGLMATAGLDPRYAPTPAGTPTPPTCTGQAVATSKSSRRSSATRTSRRRRSMRRSPRRTNSGRRTRWRRRSRSRTGSRKVLPDGRNESRRTPDSKGHPSSIALEILREPATFCAQDSDLTAVTLGELASLWCFCCPFGFHEAGWQRGIDSRGPGGNSAGATPFSPDYLA